MERADGKSGQTRTNDAPICFPGSLGDQGQTGGDRLSHLRHMARRLCVRDRIKIKPGMRDGKNPRWRCCDAPNNVRSASGSGCMSKRTSIMLEEVIKLHWFAGISPEQSFTEAGRHCEAVVAAD